MKKRWTAFVLAVALAASLLPGRARGAAPGGGAGSRLTGVERTVYDILKTEIGRVAAGERASTAFAIPDQAALSWTLDELGAGQGNVLDKVKEKFAQALDLKRVYACLSADCPYELFWAGNQYTWGYSLSSRGNRASVRDLTIYFQVAQGYQDGSGTAVSPAKVAAARRAAENARDIVARYAGRPDREKLEAYRQEICRLVSYNTDCARNGEAYGDPWQLVYVFDGDPATNVVCEGYAKAFQYLCDLSEFEGDIRCSTVFGDMNGGSHMWNVVRMDDGRNYLVDVTNCDSGMIGAPDRLFLAGGTQEDGGRTYTVLAGARPAVYSYWEEQKDLFTDGYLPLNAAGYDSAKAPAAPAFEDVPPAAYYAGAVAWAVEEEITQGTTGATFSPEQPCTHAQILTFLWRAEGEPAPREDAPLPPGTDECYADAVRWAAGEGWLGEGFDPGGTCDRASAMEYIWRAFGSPGGGQSGMFTDVSPAALSPAREAAVYWAVAREITQGTSDTTFSPFDDCDRAMIITFLYRAYH